MRTRVGRTVSIPREMRDAGRQRLPGIGAVGAWVRARLRRFLTVGRVNRMIGGLGFGFIVVSAGFIAWREWATSLREAEERARANAFFLADHASRLFEVSDIALRATASALGARSWDEIAASEPLWAEMRATSAVLPYVDNVWLNDATGRLRLTTYAFPAPPSDASGRSTFETVRAGDRGLVVGETIVGALTRKTTFLLARRLDGSDGGLRGMVSVTAELDYFRTFWSRLDLRDRERLAIVRAGSADILVQYPLAARGDAVSVGADLGFAKAPDQDAGSFPAGPGADGFFQRIGELPLFMTVVFRESAVTHAWRAWLWRFLPFPLTALAALVALMAVNERQGRVEQRARRAVDRARAELFAANRHLEERVAERTADLRESNAEIQRFAYIMSHDLRAPLVNIMGFTSELEKLRGDLFGPQPAGAPAEGGAPQWHVLRADFEEAITFIRSSTGKMDRLIKAILLLSRGGQRRYRPETLDMNALLRSVVDSVAHQAYSVGATIALGDLPTITSDRIAVEQVFSNLIDNALKYLRPGVPGTISVTGVVISGRVVFSVRDNGRGIARSDWDRVFDLFRRAGPQDQPGEGIGLAHVRSLVRRLGGAVVVDSALDQGSTFTVTLPLVLGDSDL